MQRRLFNQSSLLNTTFSRNQSWNRLSSYVIHGICQPLFTQQSPFHTSVHYLNKGEEDDDDETFLKQQLERAKSTPQRKSSAQLQKVQAIKETLKSEKEMSDVDKRISKKFYDLKLVGPMVKAAVNVMNFFEPTEIQKQVIPSAISGKHIIASAETGTGKTAAYCLPLLQHYYRIANYEARKNMIRLNPVVVVLAPTKELSEQIYQQLSNMSSALEKEEYDCIVRKSLIIGGVSKQIQIDNLKQGCDFLIGTPGRILELLKQEYLDVSQVRHLVLDECDKMLSMGFLADLKSIFSYLPKPSLEKDELKKKKNLPVQNPPEEISKNVLPFKPMQVLMFSATLTRGIEDLMYRFAPVHELVNLNETMQVASTVKHVQYHVGHHHKKFSLLLYLLKRKGSMKDKQVLVFVRTKQKAERIAERLKDANFSAEAVFKAKSVSQRTASIEKFKSGELQILISTDVLARGIDVEHLPFVVNYDIPASPEDYVHRVGRTGRAGNTGMAVSFVAHLPQLVKVGMTPAELYDVHFMKTVETFISEPVEHRKIPGPWLDETLKLGPNGLPIVDVNDENVKRVVVESKKQALKILEHKYEKERRILKHNAKSGKKAPLQRELPNLSETYLSLKQKLRQMSAKPTASLAEAVDDQRLPLTKIPSLRNFKEGRYEDIIASFDKRRAIKSGAIKREKPKLNRNKMRKHLDRR